MIVFFVTGGFIIKCVFDLNSVCTIVDLQTFGALAGAGVLELVFELKGLISIFKRKE